MKPIRLIPFLLLAVFLAVPALAQQAPSTPWMQFEQELGLATTYSVDMTIQAMGMNMESKIIRDGGKTRTEMVMPFFNLKTVILEIPENGRTVSYSLFPEKQKYLLNEEDDDATPAAAPK